MNLSFIFLQIYAVFAWWYLPVHFSFVMKLSYIVLTVNKSFFSIDSHVAAWFFADCHHLGIRLPTIHGLNHSDPQLWSVFFTKTLSLQVWSMSTIVSDSGRWLAIAGTIMTISKNRVKPSPQPYSWKLVEIFTTGIILGVYLAMMTVIFFWAADETDFFPVSIVQV